MRGSIFLLRLAISILIILMAGMASRPQLIGSPSAIPPSAILDLFPLAQFSSLDEPIRVPLDYPTIQEAINAASAGATIEVHSGLYRENPRINKRLTLKGVDSGGGIPIIDLGTGVGGIALEGNGILFENFLITTAGVGSALEISSNCNIIKNNTISNNSMDGIKLDFGAARNIVYGNNISHNGFSGVVIADGAIDNSIVKNELEHNGFSGINLKGSVSKNLLLLNRVQYNGFNGILLTDDAVDNDIVSNILYNNSFGGIDLKDNASGNMLADNRIINNTFTGLTIMDNSSRNIVFSNYLLKNIKHDAYDSGISNIWDNGTFGNYFSEFACEDKDRNGICDSPFGIPGGSGVDRYPLASFARALEPSGWGEF
jgi:parallel beta-helix repeat protein